MGNQHRRQLSRCHGAGGRFGWLYHAISHIGSEQTVRLLDEIFSAFDLLTEKHVLEKIKTIGDAYMVAGGMLYRDQIMPKRAPNWRSICGKRLSNSTGSMIRPSASG